MNRPYRGGQYKYAMKTIGPHHPFVQFDGIVNSGVFDPFMGNNFTGIVQSHLPIKDFPEQAFPIPGA